MNKNISPPELRPASTIILGRENNHQLEVYLLKRNSKSGFMGGLYVFPGGVVDREDTGFDTWGSHIDMDKNRILNHLGKKEFSFEQTLGFCIAGIRETLEESGVFLASGEDKTIDDIKEMAGYRLQDNLSGSWFKQKVFEDNWVLSLSNLKKWSHWITPEHMNKRFDTLFFMARMPENQHCAPDKKETDTGIWINPKLALEKNLEGTIPMSPPTLITLIQMQHIMTLDELEQVLENHQWPDAITPKAVKSQDGPVVLMPWDPEYENAAKIDLLEGPLKRLPFDKPFSRILNDKGRWKPVEI